MKMRKVSADATASDVSRGDSRLSDRAARLEQMIERVDLVTAPTPEVAQLVGSKPTVIVDDALDVPRIGPLGQLLVARSRRRRRRRQQTNLVWFGNSGSKNPEFGMVH